MFSLVNPTLMPINVISKSVRNLKQNSLKLYTTQTAIKVQEDKEKTNKELIKEFDRLSNISVKVRTKEPQKPPFVKNLFLGVYDTDILTYPQLEKDEVEKLDKAIEPVESYFRDLAPQLNPPHLASDFVENLRHLKLFGLQGPQLLNARELNVTESCRFNDILSSSTSTAPGLLLNDQIGIQALLKIGTEEQKKKYLPQLVNGNILSAFCLTESDTTDLAAFQTTASLSSDKKTWIINGEKTWIVNGSIADLLLVVAQTHCIDQEGIKQAKLTAFLVEKSFGGITTQPCETMGISGTDVSNIKFNNTPVPADNMLGQINSAESVMSSVITEFRLSTGAACSAILRKLMDNLVYYCTHTNSERTSISQTDYVRSVVAEIAVSLYATESATYLTAGMLDKYEKQDCLLESAIVKTFSSQQACSSALKCMELLGTPSYMKGHWCNILHRDALSHLILNEPSEKLKMNIALLGLQHAGLKIQDQIRIARNPLFHPVAVLKQMWSERKQIEDEPQLTLSLGDYLHPSVALAAEWLEYCVLRLQFATQIMLGRYGPEVVNQHIELKQLAECAIDIYIMTACLGRASRSYCIGLRHADNEILLASAYCINAMERVKDKVNKIYTGPYVTNDENYRRIAKRVFKVGRYFAEHPLTRNF